MYLIFPPTCARQGRARSSACPVLWSSSSSLLTELWLIPANRQHCPSPSSGEPVPWDAACPRELSVLSARDLLPSPGQDPRGADLGHSLTLGLRGGCGVTSPPPRGFWSLLWSLGASSSSPLRPHPGAHTGMLTWSKMSWLNVGKTSY